MQKTLIEFQLNILEHVLDTKLVTEFQLNNFTHIMLVAKNGN